MCCVKLVKCVLEQLTVMLHIAIAESETFITKLKKYDRLLESSFLSYNCHKEF